MGYRSARVVEMFLEGASYTGELRDDDGDVWICIQDNNPPLDTSCKSGASNDTSFVAQQFQQQAPKAFGDVDCFLKAKPASKGASAGGGDDIVGLKRELARLETTL